MPAETLKAPCQGDTKLVYWFEEADHTNPTLFGGKGAGLARMSGEGLPVPPGFIITTEACHQFVSTGNQLSSGLLAEVRTAMSALEERTGRCFGGGPTPLLVSVRSGAPVSMPGMMDTILNLGLNETAALALAEATGDVDFMADVYSRFGCMFADIVLGADGDELAEAVREARRTLPAGAPAAAVFGSLYSAMGGAVEDDVGERIPDDPQEQLARAITAVFTSWNSRRAVAYRKNQRIPENLGTAVVVQTMVFGNLGSPSGSGVVFTRDPSTGKPELFGEFVEGGQGEEMVAGTITPTPLAVAAQRMPETFGEFGRVAEQLERLYQDVLDIEFTVEEGKLWLLQVRSAKRTAAAAVRIAADFVREGTATAAQALTTVTTDHIRLAERPRFDVAALEAARAGGGLLGTGIGASPGQVSGVAVLDPERAVERAEAGESVILTRQTTSPLDLHGMLASSGIVTALGGATSHAAVVARALGKPCVVGCGGLTFAPEGRRLTFNGTTVEEGAPLSIDGASGDVFAATIPTVQAKASGSDLSDVMRVAREASRCSIYGTASTVTQVETVIKRGAAGVATRISDVLATTGRFEGLIERLMAQRAADTPDLKGFEEVIADVFTPILLAAGDVSVAVRAIHVIDEDAAEAMDRERLLAHCPRLGVPLGIPELFRVQLAGLVLAAREAGYPQPIDLVVRHLSDPAETTELRRIAAAELVGDHARRVRVGAFITSPRGAQRARELAATTDFLWLDVWRLVVGSFGYPASVFLAGEPLDEYLRRGMLSVDPRRAVDESMTAVLTQFVAARLAHPECRQGVRLSGQVSEELAAAFYRAGFRTFGVDADEIRAADLALGKAALAEEVE